MYHGRTLTFRVGNKTFILNWCQMDEISHSSPKAQFYTATIPVIQNLEFPSSIGIVMKCDIRRNSLLWHMAFFDMLPEIWSLLKGQNESAQIRMDNTLRRDARSDITKFEFIENVARLCSIDFTNLKIRLFKSLLHLQIVYLRIR